MSTEAHLDGIARRTLEVDIEGGFDSKSGVQDEFAIQLLE
jgi:hypothetical protein